MADGRLLGKIDGYIQDHLQEISEQDDFLKLPRLKVCLSIYIYLKSVATKCFFCIIPFITVSI